MLVLDIEIDLGPGAAPIQVEALVRAVRVATDVGRDAELRRVRRTASEQMKFPTDAELLAAVDRLPQGAEDSPSYRARRHLDVRRRLASDAEELPPGIWLEYWYRRSGRDKRVYSYLRDTGYDRALSAAAPPWVFGAAPGLDALDPVLYQALVADQCARLAPGEIVVREVRYQNPFGEVLAGARAAEGAVKATAGVIETAATLGSRRKLKKVEARVAEETVEEQIESARLDVELKRQQVRRSQIENEIAEQELLAKQIQNAQALAALSAQRKQQMLVEHFLSSGELDAADAVADADPSDAAMLIEFALRPPALEKTEEPDPDEES